MVDMSKTIAPKSDQLNFDDLVSGPVLIKITDVRGEASPEQPVSISFEGDGGKPYKPCKSMRRVMVAVWGPDARQYVGRALRLYGDPKVKFGGIEVGGIRISHMSNIDQPVMIPLTVAKARRTPYRIEPLRADDLAPQSQGQTQDQDSAPDPSYVAELIVRAKGKAEEGQAVYRSFFQDDISRGDRNILTTETEEDVGDFNTVKPVHEICKGIAQAADARDNEGADNGY